MTRRWLSALVALAACATALGSAGSLPDRSAAARKPAKPCLAARQTGCKLAPTRYAKELYYRVGLGFAGKYTLTTTSPGVKTVSTRTSAWSAGSTGPVRILHRCGPQYAFPGPSRSRKAHPKGCPPGYPEGVRFNSRATFEFSEHEVVDTTTVASAERWACQEVTLVRRSVLDGVQEAPGGVASNTRGISWWADMRWTSKDGNARPGELRMTYKESPCTDPPTKIVKNEALTKAQERGAVPLGFQVSLPQGSPAQDAQAQLALPVGQNFGNTLVSEATLRWEHSPNVAQGQPKTTETWDLHWTLVLTPCPWHGAKSC